MKNSRLNLDLEGSHSLLVGASLGVGFELARLLLEAGSSLCIVGRDPEKLFSAKETLDALGGKKKTKIVSANGYKEQGRNFIFKEVNKWCSGRLDHLVSFIGSGKTPTGYNQELTTWKEVFNNNFFSVIDLVNLLLPIIDNTSGRSSITITSAIAGLERVGAPITYSCAKAALSSYIPHLAAELSHFPIRVNGVNPGNIFFPGGRWEEIINEQTLSKVEQKVLSNVSLKRFGTPEEIAWVYLMLMTPKNAFTTGTNYVIDGQQVKKTI